MDPGIHNSIFPLIGSLLLVLLFTVKLTLWYSRRLYKKENERKFRELLTHGVIFKSTIEIEERHKERIAKNLHDGVNSQLTLVIYALNKHQADLRANQLTEDDLEKDKALIQKIVAEISDTCNNLVPSSLRQFGLLRTLEDHMESLGASPTVKADFVCRNPYLDISILRWKDQLSIYRICQELLTNILKHAHCTQVTLSVFTDRDVICFEFEHDGAGISNAEIEKLRSKGLGLNSLKTRALLLKASIDYLKGKNSSSIQLRVPAR